MELMVGTKLGPYEIVGYVGAGAMGVVYRARDTRLGREVAVKVLPPIFAADPDRLARFDREARAVAAINHPNIVSVYDIGSADVPGPSQSMVRATYLITELLDGDTLRACLANGPLSARKSADIAMQVARGLAAAHDRGIVHRDLKPENLVLLRDGQVKILDFGLAKQSTPAMGSAEQQTLAATDAGTVLGTVGYMAPEQVRGEAVDPRADLFALGAVLHELASGQRAFSRPTAAETMTAILREDPPEAVTASLPPAISRIVRHALEKDPGNRFQSARDFAFALQAVGDASGSGVAPVSLETAARPPVPRRESMAWVLVALLGLALAALSLWPWSAASTSASPVVFSPTLPMRDSTLTSPSVSPDGSRIAFVSEGRTGETIAVRRLDAMDAQSIKGTLGARAGSLFWAPDGQSLGFCAGGKLKTIELSSEKVEEIASAPSCYGGAWGPDGTILFSPDERTPLLRVNARGGDAKPATTLDAAHHEEAHRWPQFLPDGRHFIFMPWSLGTTTRMIQLGSLDGAPPKALFESESAAIVAGHYFIYVRDLPSRLLAQAFNADSLPLEGRPVAVVDDDNVDYFWFSGAPLASASAGMLVYTTGKYRSTQMTWFNRAGRPVGTVGDPDVYYDSALSLDGTNLVVEKRDGARGATDLWTVNLARSAFSRLTSAPGFESTATWSPDGRRIAFASDQQQRPGIWVKSANGTGAEEKLVEGRSFPTDWSRDGRYLLYMASGGATRQDVWVYDVEQKSSRALIASPFNESRARFSPDGRWVAYVSDEAQTAQVYVRSFSDGATKIPISTAGGDAPEWRRDGNEIFYLAPDNTLMSVDVHPSGASLHVGAAQALFATNAELGRVLRNTYAASADGQRFLVISSIVAPGASPLVGVLNWMAGLSRKP